MEIKEQLEMAKRIIERDGDCNEADCKECPFGKMCDATDANIVEEKVLKFINREVE